MGFAGGPGVRERGSGRADSLHVGLRSERVWSDTLVGWGRGGFLLQTPSGAAARGQELPRSLGVQNQLPVLP